MNLENDTAKISAFKHTPVELELAAVYELRDQQHQAEIEALYAGRLFSRLPRNAERNFVHNMIALLSA